jgi:hypothetical protein
MNISSPQGSHLWTINMEDALYIYTNKRSHSRDYNHLLDIVNREHTRGKRINMYSPSTNLEKKETEYFVEHSGAEVLDKVVEWFC